MIELLGFLTEFLRLYMIVVFAAVIVQMLVQSRTVTYSPFMRSLHMGLSAVTEPLLQPIRRRLPSSGGIDFAPLVLLVGIWFLRDVIIPNVAKAI